MSELTVILKDESRTYRQKFLCYNSFQAIDSDPFIIQCIADAKKQFEGEPDSIKIKIAIEVQ